MQSALNVNAFEGAFALCNSPYQPDGGAPYPTATGGAGQFVAATGGLIMGRFGWPDISSGEAFNTPVAGVCPAIVLPQRGTWARVFYDPTVCAWRVRQGLPVTLCTAGAFWLRFAGGAVANSQVYADPLDGHAVSGYAAGAIASPWYVVTNAGPGMLAIVSTSVKFGA